MIIYLSHVVRLIDYFFLASALNINVHKSNLVGFEFQLSVVEDVVGSIGCVPKKSPFKYLGLIMGGNMSRISS